MTRNKILVFGDSITYGQLDLEMGGWVNRLRLRLANDSSIASCHVFNMGISGQTTGEILERFERECKGRVLEDFNNIIVIAAGINDSQLFDNAPLADEEELRANVKALIEKAKALTPKVIYVGLTPVDDNRTIPFIWDKSRKWINERVAAYDEIISTVCSEMGVRYVYVYDQIDPATNADGLHPSEEGHEKLAEIMDNVIRDYCKEERLSAAMIKNEGLFSSLKKILFKK
jgi:lysophospholipase L1-like esterase